MTMTVQDIQTKEMGDAVKEAAIALQRMADARSFIRDIKDNLKSKGHDKEDIKNIRKLAKLYLEQNAEKVRAENEALFDRYESLKI